MDLGLELPHVYVYLMGFACSESRSTMIRTRGLCFAVVGDVPLGGWNTGPTARVSVPFVAK